MKEFKFACPVCGQHITAAAGTSGTQIECPTCFQRIIVPQARSDETKLILNAAKADRPRPPQTVAQQGGATSDQPKSRAWIGAVAALLLLCALGVAAYMFRDRFQHRNDQGHAQTKGPGPGGGAEVSNKGQVPTNAIWTLDPEKAHIPPDPVVGMINGEGFTLTRAVLQGGTLSIRQGKGWPPELAIAIPFPAKRGEDLAEKKVFVAADQAPPVPKVVMRWKNQEGKSVTKTFPGGYLLRLEFGRLENAKIPGELYIALPDDQRSFMAGAFVADVRPPEAPKQRKPKQPAVTNTAP